MNISAICQSINRLAPEHLAQDWDNVGLLIGDRRAQCARVMVCGDLTPAVLDEAIANDTHLILAYHPPLFRPISRLHADSTETDAIVWRAIANGIAVYATHTALDAADGGTNDVLAAMCGATDLEPFEYVDAPTRELKLVVFVPHEHVEQVADILSTAGAGVIGNYDRCSFRVPGSGTFRGSAESRPTVGSAEQLETVAEIRLEMLLPAACLPDVVAALRSVHPYEEPAFDIYPLKARPLAGIGRTGKLDPPSTTGHLAQHLAQQIPGAPVTIVGDKTAKITRVVICVGAAGSLVLGTGLGPNDCVLTGELRHHEALAIERCGASAVCLGHWSSEHPGVAHLAARLASDLKGVAVELSRCDREPFRTPAD